MQTKQTDFYLGANTPEGFVSRYDQIAQDDTLERVYVIKGGPGTGKSSMMKMTAEVLSENGADVERIHCSSDPDSLDAVICREKKIAMLDGTPPHVMEPQYPGAFETIVDLYPCWDQEGLMENLPEIKELFGQYRACHRKACAYLSAAAALNRENRKSVQNGFAYEKAVAYAQNLARRLFGKTGGDGANESVRFLSAVTPQGVKTYLSTVETLCDRVYLLQDDTGLGADTVLRVLRKRALEQNYGIITCYCVLAPYDQMEHLFIPQLRLGFLTSNKFHPISFSKAVKRVKASRFISAEKSTREYRSFNKRAAKEFVAQAVNCMQEAKQYHDRLEQYYIRHVDYEKLREKNREVLEEILK